MTFIPNAMHLLAEQTVTGAAVSTITFDNTTGPAISIVNDREYRLYVDVANTSGFTNTYYLFFNGDTTKTNYFYEIIRAAGGAVATANHNSTNITDSAIPNNETFSSIIDIQFSLSQFPAYSLITRNFSGGTMQWVSIVGRYNGAPQIDLTSIVLQAQDAGNVVRNGFGIGSKFRLYRTSPI